MDDKLEKFIKSHRDEMDDKYPRKDLWKDIERQIDTNKKERSLSVRMIYWRAAAVFLLLITSWLVFDKVYQTSVDDQMPEVAITNPQLLEAESFYVSLINEKKQVIASMSDKYDLSENFLREIDVLDSMYVVLKNDLKQGNEENLVDAMILNLQLRIEILNKQLSIIQSIENSQKDEKVIL